MSRFIYFSEYKPEIFLANTPLWQWQINHYPVVMIFFNVLLAALAMYVTYLLVRGFQEKKRSYPKLAILGLVWLIVMPNAAYIMTDARHIIGYCPIEEYGHVCAGNAWMTVFFFAYALIGWLSFIYCLRPLKRAIENKRGKNIAWLFAVIVIVLTALGVLLGLVNRWNSWDIFFNPGLLIKTIIQYLTTGVYLKNWLAMTVILHILYGIGDRLCRDLPYEQKSR